jgi:hypothetical protein
MSRGRDRPVQPSPPVDTLRSAISSNVSPREYGGATKAVRTTWLPPLLQRLISEVKGRRPFAGPACASEGEGRSPVISARNSIGQARIPLRLPVLRRGHPEMGRTLRDLRRMEHRRGRNRRRPPRPRRQSPGRPRRRIRRPRRHHRTSPSGADRHRRTGPRAGRRPRSSLRRAGWRRSRHRQIDAAATSRRLPRPLRPAGAICHGRRIYRSNPPARAPSRRCRLLDRTGRRDQRPRHRNQPGTGQGHHARGDRLDPDHVDGHDRERARHRHPGPSS